LKNFLGTARTDRQTNTVALIYKINMTSLIGELMCCKESVGYIKLQRGMEEEEKWV